MLAIKPLKPTAQSFAAQKMSEDISETSDPTSVNIEIRPSFVNKSRRGENSTAIPTVQMLSLDEFGSIPKDCILMHPSNEFEADLDHSSTCGTNNEDNPYSNPNRCAMDHSELKREKSRKRLTVLQRIFCVCFMLLAVAVSFLFYWILRRNETMNFENAFIMDIADFVSSIEKRLIWNKVSTLRTMAVAANPFSLTESANSFASWPTYLIPNFEDLASISASSSNDNTVFPVIFAPLVTDESRVEWELVSANGNHEANDFSPSETAKTIYRFETDAGSNNLPGNGKSDVGNTNENISYNETLSDYGPGPYFPVSQHIPYLKEMFNFNLLSNNDLRDDIGAMMDSGNAVIGRITSAVFNENTTLSSKYYNLIFATKEEDLVEQQPMSHIFYPVYDNLPRGARDNQKQLVGFFATIIFWNDIVKNSIPLDYSIKSSGAPITLVIKSGCADEETHKYSEQSLTYEVDDGESIFLGYGDLHNRDLSSYSHDAFFDIQEYFTAAQESINSGVGNNRRCSYSFRFYPSEQYVYEYVTSWPKISATICGVSFICLFAIILIYNHIMNKFVHSFSVEVRLSRAIVTSFFPENVQSRVFERQESNNEERSKHNGSKRFVTDLTFNKRISFCSKEARNSSIADVEEEDEERRDSVDEAIEWEPIADFFPHCTVLFGDLAGFTSWSSSRTPAQVFTLLQVLFAMFDKAAKIHKVFKVETIGDCYLCVTGLPNAQADHAVRMVKFARTIITKMSPLVKKLERTLGPGTSDLRLRIGIHSGPVTGGVLRGEKSRFQLFGDTVNTASRVESTGERNRIQISQTTADLLNQAGKSHWFKARSEFVHAKGKGEMQTYWIILRSVENGSSEDTFSLYDQRSSCSSRSSSLSVSESKCSFHNLISIWGADSDDNVDSTSPKMARSQKNKRMVLWMVEILKPRLKQMISQRRFTETRRMSSNSFTAGTSCSSKEEEMMKDARFHGGNLLGEVVESFTPPEQLGFELEFVEEADLNPDVVWQLHSFVTKVASMYRDNPFHNFEHACHVTQSVDKLLNHVENHHICDCLAQFAIIFSALIHDVDHRGVSNLQLNKEYPEMGEKYNKRSIAEQNSIDLSWELLMDPAHQDLQKCIFTNEFELQRFRQIVVNSVLATDIFDKEGKSFRERRWGRAFNEEAVVGLGVDNHAEMSQEAMLSNLKATIVIEHIIQASDVAHTMQHWNVYTKWNERLFQEMYAAFDCGRLAGDPSDNWYRGELWFFDNYVIPLAKKLDHCSVFGVAYDECLNNAVENREEWRRKGKEVVQEMKDRYHKRKSMEIGGFTDEEIGSFTPEDLEYIMKKLIEKGRNNGTKSQVDSVKGQNDAAQAWLDALEIWERAPAALEMRDRTIIFPIFSGIIVWIKGGKIRQDEEKNFEQNLANIFVRESRLHGDPVHYTRALAMKCEVMCRLGKYDIAFNAFEEMKSIYIPAKHSLAVAEVYGTDRSMHAFSQSALWHMALGNTDAALETCNYVIDDLLPQMDPTNTLGKSELLLPVFYTLKRIGGHEQRLRDLMKVNIIEEFLKFHGPNAFTPAKPVHRPLLMLFEICHDPDGFPNFLEAVEWLLKDANGEVPDFLDNIWVKLCWSMHGACAELCLRFANKLGQYENTDELLEKRKKLIAKGLRNAKKADLKMKGADGAVILPIPYAIHESVFRELKEVASSLDMKEEKQDDTCVGGAPQLDVNLPLSYLKPPAHETD